jgi:hypothetical protein
VDPVAQELAVLQGLALGNAVVVDKPFLFALGKSVLKFEKCFAIKASFCNLETASKE